MDPFPVLRVRGIPRLCPDEDIPDFFGGFVLRDVLRSSRHSQFSGDAFVAFESHAEAARARDQNHRRRMGSRHVDVVWCDREDYYNAIFYSNVDPRPYTRILRLRNLQSTVEKGDIWAFFWDYNVGEDRIRIVRGGDGGCTGEAFVEFRSEEEARTALMQKDMKVIDYIRVELLPSSPAHAAVRGILFQD